MIERYFEKEYRIHVYETDPKGTASLTSLFNYMQDIASEHAVKLGYGRDDLIKNNNFWVLSRMYALISEWPSWEEKITVRTWPNGTDKLFALRNYELYFPDGRKFASAVSSWLIVDRSTKKIQRPDNVLSLYRPEYQDNKSYFKNCTKLPGVTASGNRNPGFAVKISDLDLNLHTNNVNYFKWVTDTYDLNFVLNHLPCSAEINYLAESMYGEEVFILTREDKVEDYFYNHSVFRISDSKELCRVRLGWKKR